MKKIALLMILGLSISFAQAQAKFGVKVGANYSNLSGDLTDEDANQSKVGLLGGIIANFPLSSDNFVSIQPELLYSQKGYQYQDEEVNIAGAMYNYKGKFNFNYLDLPVLLKINAGPIFFEAGPQASYLLGIRDNRERELNGIDDKSWAKVEKDNLSELEIGYVAGLGFQAPMGVGIGLRYNGSINALAKDNSDELTNARHSVFQLQLSYMLGGAAQ